jgi:hypothetical protein
MARNPHYAQVGTFPEPINLRYPAPESIARKVRDTLLRLGIPCYQDYLNIRLAPGLHNKDYPYLKRILGHHALPRRIQSKLIDCQPLIQINDFDGSMLYRFQTISAELFLYRSPALLRERREVSYMTGPNSSGTRDSSLNGFIKTRYGAKVPIEQLEHGVALFVKLLPWLGIRSSMSCAGHVTPNGFTAPRIWLFGRYHLAWLQHILTELFGDYSIAQTWTFTYTQKPVPQKNHGFDPDWASGCFQLHPDWPDRSIESRKAHRRCLEDLFLIARRLLDPDLCEHFRSIKDDWAKEYHCRFIQHHEGQAKAPEDRMAG